MPWALLGAAVIGAGGSYLSANSANKTAKKAQEAGEKAAAKANYQEGLGEMEFQASRAQKNAAEQARLGLDLDLGRPGTYEMNYEDFYANMQKDTNNQYAQMQILPGGSSLANNLDIYDTTTPDLIKLRNAIPSERFYANEVNTVEGLDRKLKSVGIGGGVSAFDDAAVQEFIKNPTGAMEGKYKELLKGGYPGQTATWELPDIIDPEKFTALYEKSRQYREVSYLTAQSDQIVRKQGPYYESMKESVLGPIYQNAASLQRAGAEDIAKQVARGGSARLQGLKEAERFRMMDRINAGKVNALWQANLALDQWGIDNARRQLLFNQQWLQGIPGIRDDFNNAMTNLSQFFSGTMVPHSQENAYYAAQATQDRTVDLMGMLGGALVQAAGIFGSGAATLFGGGPKEGSAGTASGDRIVGDATPEGYGGGVTSAQFDARFKNGGSYAGGGIFGNLFGGN